jgi:hypothetical protein
MMRVVESRPGAAEMAACGLTAKDIWVDPETYRHFVAQFRKEVSAFEQQRAAGTAEGGQKAVTHPGAGASAGDEAWIQAFDRSRQPYHYRQGSIYRYRIGSAAAEGPIILECLERSEITGALLGVPFTSQRTGLLMRLCLWIEERIRIREERKKG